MKPYAEIFYSSKAWKQCRAAYKQYRAGLCESCLRRGIYRAGVIVHHKIHITPDNINDPAITMSFDNLELLCRDCHAAEHGRKVSRYVVDGMGRVAIKN